ncbi:MAG TPA: hypothetical protein ENN64_00150 [bacterium]|nr:hypothetical protein [bacterium]
MKLPFFKKTKESTEFIPGEKYVSIDIGTEYLKSLLFSANDLGVIVEKISRIQQQQNAMNKGMIINLNTVLENCRLSINELTSDIDSSTIPTKVVMGIAGEFVQGVSIIVNYEREDEKTEAVTEKEQTKIIEMVYDQISQSGKEDLSKRTGLLPNDIEILHVTVSGLEIGGVSVQSLVGFKGKSVKLYFYASFAPKTFVDSLKTLADSLEMEVIAVVSQPFAVARAFSGARNKDFSGIFVDIGGGTTDIAVVNKGNVIDTQMFAFGGRVFTKEIAKEMNLDYRHAESRKIKYSENKLEKPIQDETKSICYNLSKLWMTCFQSALEMCEDVEIFPNQIYLCGGGAMLPDIKNVMMEFPWTRLLPFTNVPKINIFLPNKLSEIIDDSGDLINPYDVTPAALAKFAYDKIKYPENYYSQLE